MPNVAARTPPKRRSGRRYVIALLAVVVLVVAAIIGLNVAALADVSGFGALTVYQPAASIAHNGGAAAVASTGAVVLPGDSVSTDAKGRAAVMLPDGTVTRLAGGTTTRLDAVHFARNGRLQGASFTQEIGRTFTNVQHLVSGASFEVHGKTATASVRGTKFEIYIATDGSMTVKLFDGTLVLTAGRVSVTLHSGQQVTVAADGTIGQVGPITLDPNDPFGPQVDASNAVGSGTTPGTEQDFVGAPVHNGGSQQFTYSYAGGSLVKAALGYAGGAMKLTVKAPDGSQYVGQGKLPVVNVNNAPAGIYMVIVTGTSGLGAEGEEPFVAVASLESCATADIARNLAVHRAYTAADLVSSIRLSGQVPGLSGLHLALGPDTVFGAVISGGGTYNGIGWAGTVVLFARDGDLDLMPTAASIFGINVPPMQVVQQVAAVTGQDPSNIKAGFIIDRLFTCHSVLMIDGRAP
jgi:FecR protein